jgi:hypothetical protein
MPATRQAGDLAKEDPQAWRKRCAKKLKAVRRNHLEHYAPHTLGEAVKLVRRQRAEEARATRGRSKA